MSNVQILKITKMEITVKKSRKSMKFMISSIISIVILTIALSFEGLSSITSGMVHIYNPVNSLYNDTGDVVFTSGSIIEKEMLDFIKGRFQIRQCKKFKSNQRACLNYHIKKCLAPCEGYVSKEEYRKQGVAKKIFEYIIEYAKINGYKSIHLTCFIRTFSMT